MFSWLWTTTPDVTFVNEENASSAVEYRLQHKQPTSADIQNLPKLPFEYQVAKPHVFICRSPNWSFACLITDLDYQFMQHLAKSKAELYFGDECFAELLDNCTVCHSTPAHIEEFCELFQVNSIYEGVASANLWDVLIALEPAESLSFDPTLDQLYKDVCKHHEHYYDTTTEVVQCM